MLFPDTLCSMTILLHLSSFSSLPNILSLFLSFCFSPSLSLQGHGATQGFGCFGEFHESRLDRGKISCDLVHGPLAGTDSIWSGEGLQVLLGVRGPAPEPDAQLCGGEDGQGEGVSLRQQLVLPHPSFNGAHSEDTGGAGLYQRTCLPLSGQSLPARVIVHVHCLPAGIREQLKLESVGALTVIYLLN